jgi:hypothetical protein
MLRLKVRISISTEFLGEIDRSTQGSFRRGIDNRCLTEGSDRVRVLKG